MRTFTTQQQITNISRLSYSGSPKVGTRTSTGFTTTGYLRPLSEDQAAVNQLQWGIGYTLITEIDVDIQVGDILTIAGNTYTVRGKADHSRGGNSNTGYFKFLVVAPQA